MRALLGLVAALALPALAVIALHRMGSLDWLRIDFTDVSGWTRRTRVEDALAAVLRYVALAGGYWLLGSTMLYLVARISGSVRLIDVTSVLTLPVVRRVTDRRAQQLTTIVQNMPRDTWPTITEAFTAFSAAAGEPGDVDVFGWDAPTR